MGIFDAIIVGKGLIGCAAAKYVSNDEGKVAIIGPDEPAEAIDALVYSSHYDQARIQRLIGSDEVWTMLNKQSAAQYDFLEKESRISFHSKPGCLYVNPHGADNYIARAGHQAERFGLHYKSFETGQDIKNSFADFDFPEMSTGIYEPAPSGFINPRSLIKAQLEIFRKNKGIVYNDIVTKISKKEDYFKIATVGKEVHMAKKVLLSPGAFINFFDLIENKLMLTLKSETTLLAQVDKVEAKRLSALPSLLYEIDIPHYRNIYLIQPIQYPDGKYYIKMGCNLPGDLYFNSITAVHDWFGKGESDINLEVLKTALQKILPTAKIRGFFTKRCIVSFTKHRKPYIGAVNDKGLFIACGGNGYSAMCSDALGRIAAQVLVKGNFPADYSATTFQPVFSHDN